MTPKSFLSLSNIHHIKVPYFILAKGSPHEGGNMINKVLAIIVYISDICDSKLIVKKVVWRKNKIGGGVYESKVAITYMYIYIYIYIYIYRERERCV